MAVGGLESAAGAQPRHQKLEARALRAGMRVRIGGGVQTLTGSVNTSSGRRSLTYRDADGELQVTICSPDRMFTVVEA